MKGGGAGGFDRAAYLEGGKDARRPEMKKKICLENI